MVLKVTPICDFGWKAIDFNLPATDGQNYSLQNIKGENGTVIVFICNHCPYVKSIISRLVFEANELKKVGIGFAAISSNDANEYPEDSFEEMAKYATDNKFNFPYLYDEKQDIAKAYDAVCTPDFFGFNSNLELQYRGRLDESKMELVPNAPRELYNAMTMVVETGKGPEKQIASQGCSIKWRY